MNPVAPTISMNGSSPDRLIESLKEAHNKIEEARKALNECFPHGRDYLQGRHDDLNGEVAFSTARHEACERDEILGRMQESLLSVIEQIDAQVASRTGGAS